MHEFFWIYPRSQQQESHIVPFIVIVTWGRHYRVSRIPWGVCNEELDNRWKKVALTVWCQHKSGWQFGSGRPKQLQAILQPGVADYLALFVFGSQNSYDLFPQHQVADYSVLFVSGSLSSYPAGILEYKWLFYVILYVIILFDIEIDIKIRFILFVETVFLRDFLCYI